MQINNIITNKSYDKNNSYNKKTYNKSSVKKIKAIKNKYINYTINENTIKKVKEISRHTNVWFVSGHYRRYNTKDLQELLREIGYSIIKTQHYDFILSGYLELLLSRTFTRDNLFKRVLFRICLNIIMFEDFLFNLLRIRKSGGIFILAQKTK